MRIIFGCGGHGRVVLDAARSEGMGCEWVVDDNPSTIRLDGVEVVKSDEARWLQCSDFEFVVAIGRNDIRARKAEQLEAKGGVPILIQHRSAVVSTFAEVSKGSVVFAGAIVNPGARIGRHVILNTACSVDHDCVLGDYVHICPGVRLAGNVEVGKGVMIGTGASVIPGVKIGAWSIVGAGSVVIKSVPPGTVVFGNPARMIRSLNPPSVSG